MTESWLGVLLLGVLSFCAIIMTVTVVMTARDLRRVLRRVHRMLPACDQAIQEVHQTFQEARKILTRAQQATAHFEAAIHQACLTTTDLMEQFGSWPTRAKRFFEGRFGNGARSGPRQR